MMLIATLLLLTELRQKDQTSLALRRCVTYPGPYIRTCVYSVNQVH